MQDREYEIILFHRFFKLDNRLLCVAVDDRLVDIKLTVKFHEDVKLPLCLLACYVVLIDTFEGEVLLADEDASWFVHEHRCEVEDILREGR